MGVTVIIPTLNEEKTIRQVIQLIESSALAPEIIVVDDKSTDNTVQAAKQTSAKIITSTRLGKGASMRDGLLIAREDIIMYIDADITTYPEDIVNLLVSPIIYNEADFVKSFFQRQAGRVTELVAKPLLSILYPELSYFQQPLSGMIAGRKSFFENIEFENDYGVDIGILIDMHNIGARIKEVNIGNIENRMQSLGELGKMSKQVTKAILKRSRSLADSTLETFENISVIREQMDFAIRDSVKSLRKIAIFDMDNTILKTSFIQTLSQKYNFEKELKDIAVQTSNPFLRTKKIAQLVKGLSIAEIIETADSMELSDAAAEVIKTIKQAGFITGIISDSYDCVTNHIMTRLDMDFSLANELEFSKSIATGEVKIPSFFMKTRNSSCEHDYCKLHAVHELARRYEVEIKNIVAVGDGENDICMINAAGIGVSFCSDNKLLRSVADYIIEKPSLRPLLDIVL
jgi:phosphoserine phosphatase SerB